MPLPQLTHAWGEGKAWQTVGAMLATAVINRVNTERSWSHLCLIGELRSGCGQALAATAPDSASGYRGKSAELNPLMQELNSAFPALIHSFIPYFSQSTGVVKSCPDLSPICLWGEGERNAAQKS